MNVYFVPAFSNENEYIKNITTGLKNNGVKILSEKNQNKWLVPFDSIIKSIISSEYVVHFNWIENKISGNIFKRYINFIFIYIWISLLDLSGAKICWTMHNKLPHNADKKLSLLNSFYSFLMKKCNLIVIHCKETQKILTDNYMYRGKILYIPHGSYIKNKNESVSFDRMNLNEFLYFGAISEYKNIPILIDAFKEVASVNDQISIRICGKCKDEKLDKLIRNKIEHFNNIKYINKFISEEELNEAFERCCAVILPYEKNSMLNSGSAIMAFSKGRGVIISKFGYINDISDKKFVFSYDYLDSKDHQIKLRDAILETLKKAGNDLSFWKRVGNEAFDFAKYELFWDDICKKLKKEYINIFRN